MAKTGSERTTAWRASLIEQGYRSKSFLLSPRAVKALAQRAKEQGVNETQLIEALLTEPAPAPRKRPPSPARES